MSRLTRRAALLLAGAALITGALASPVSAITDGQLDGDGHPYVGLMVAQLEDGTPLWRCSGTLISESVFLTAGHCTEAPAARAEIWFESDMTTANPAAADYPFTGQTGGRAYAHPDFNPNNFVTRDVGVVVLDAPYTGTNGQFGVLPALNQLDALKTGRGQKDVTFTAVGYGLQESFPAQSANNSVALASAPGRAPEAEPDQHPGLHGRLLHAAVEQREDRRHLLRRTPVAPTSSMTATWSRQSRRSASTATVPAPEASSGWIARGRSTGSPRS